MWPSSRSNRRARRADPSRGFTLLEAMVSLLLLVIIIIVAMTMLFQMRAFAERQQYFMMPRQAARRATDYLSYYIAGASDLNYNTTDPTQQCPNALITHYNSGGALTQASFNNLTGNPGVEPGNSILAASGLRPANRSTTFGDIGTDTITLVAPFNPSRYQVFAPFPALAANADLFLNFRAAAERATRRTWPRSRPRRASTARRARSSCSSTRSGSWTYVRIPAAGYDDTITLASCADVATYKNIHIQVDTTGATLAPPFGSAGLTDPVYLVAGLQVISFRVLTDSRRRHSQAAAEARSLRPRDGQPGHGLHERHGERRRPPDRLPLPERRDLEHGQPDDRLHRPGLSRVRRPRAVPGRAHRGRRRRSTSGT